MTALDRLRDETLTELEQVVKDAYADHADDCADRPDELLDDPTAWLPAAWLEALLSEVRRHRHIPADVLAGLLDGTMVAVPVVSKWPSDNAKSLRTLGTSALLQSLKPIFDGSADEIDHLRAMLAAAKQEDRA